MAGGLGQRLGIDPTILRVAFIVLGIAGGSGVLLYFLVWLVTSDPEGEPAAPCRPLRSGVRQVLAVGFIVAGALLLVRETGLWFGDAVTWSIAVAGLGATVIWARGDTEDATRWARMTSGVPANPFEALFAGRTSPARIGAGALLIVIGTTTLVAANISLEAARSIAFPIAVTIAGLSLIVGPWLWRLARQLAEERRERIRSEERSEMAAHLHDSVLQTLALIQRSDQPNEMASLARLQERELRAWLYSGRKSTPEDRLSDAIDAMAGRVEKMHDVRVETVVVSDVALDEPVRALVHACGEAVINAAKHSGARAVSLYVEADDEWITAYVRDQGAGFDLGGMAGYGRGIEDSIYGRMERQGGAATITSAPNEGTEVQLRVPRRKR